MPFSININPRDYLKVEEIKAKVYEEGKGNCVILNIGDNTIILHYGKPENRYEFVLRLKRVIAELPNETSVCPTCGIKY